MTLSKVVRKGSYQGVAQWGISTSAEITPSRATARKWAELENAQNVKTRALTLCTDCGAGIPAIAANNGQTRCYLCTSKTSHIR